MRQARARWTLTALGLSLSLSLGGVGVTATGVAHAATARVSSRVSVLADPMTVHVGSMIVLSGNATPASSAPVYLQRYVAGHWRTLGHKTPHLAGAYSFTVKAPGTARTWIFRVVRAATSTTTAAISRTRHIKISKASFHVKATSPSHVAAGTPLVVTGSVSPKATGLVTLQILRDKVWTGLAVAPLTQQSTFTLQANGPTGAYRLRVVKPFSSTIAGGVSPAQDVAFESDPTVPTPPPVVPGAPGTPSAASLKVTSPDDPLLALSATRLIFSAVHGGVLPPARSITITNSGTASATVSGVAITGADASSYALAPAQQKTFVVPGATSVSIPVTFQPTAPTNCPTANAVTLSNANRNASLSFTTDDPALPSVSASLGGVISCAYGGNGEPVLSQITRALGYTDTVYPTGGDPRFLGVTIQPGTDEIASPYFTAADPALPVSVTALAHYSSPSTVPYHATGWYAKGATLPTDGSCNAACNQLWDFPADPSTTTYNQNQKLMPTTVGTTTFTASGTFGLWTGDKQDVVFSDDALNPQSTAGGTGPHDERVYPAYGPGHIAIPNTYLIAIDTGRASESKNHDFQDVVLIVRNVKSAS
ncbi:hypothetical protein acdb102_12600 [Acidothermaceae bacterium B102]|nr:hypothetical protein acdb102_12600 [Acidothermaceae bacterium B102]